MTAFLSDEWFAAYAEAMGALPEIDGVDAIVQHEVAGAPGGKVRFHETWRRGQLAEVASGKHGEPDVTAIWKYDQAVDEFSGAKRIEVAFMEGRAKIEGDYRRYLMHFAPLRASEAWRQARDGLAADTEFAS